MAINAIRALAIKKLMAHSCRATPHSFGQFRPIELREILIISHGKSVAISIQQSCTNHIPIPMYTYKVDVYLPIFELHLKLGCPISNVRAIST